MSVTVTSMLKQPDILDDTVAFLKKREGIDKTLKVIRYSTKLLLATALDGSASELSVRLKRFESSIGTSRKAYKLGKFLQQLNSMRKTPLRSPYGLLAWVASGGDAVYYFMAQIQWLIQAGLLPDHYSSRLGRISAWGELVGYVASISLGVLRINAILERELALIGELQRRRKLGEDSEELDKPLVAEIRLLRARRALRTLGLAQDLADALLALADMRPEGSKGGLLGSKAVLAAAGLLSGALSFYKNWPGVDK